MERSVLNRATARTGRDEEIVELLRAVNRTLRERLMQAASGRKRSLATLSVLRAIGNDPGITVNEVARRRYMPKSLVSIIVADLAEDGLVRKGRDPADQRLVRLRLSAAGTRELERWRATYRSIAADAVGSLAADDARDLLSGLRALHGALTATEAGR
jgi:DNA-binding MarR family transcriptional regulator